MLDDVEDIISKTNEENIFDTEEIHTNCTVQVLKNSKTGEVSIGWYENTPSTLN